MELTIHERMLLQLLRISVGTAHKEWTLSLSDETWKSVFTLAEQHHILPLVLEAAYSAKAQIPERILTVYKRRAAQIIFIQAQKTALFLDLYRFLNEKGLYPLVIKGIICRNLYPVPDYRFSADEDLLIQKEKVQACYDVLTEYGLAADQPENEVLSSFETGYTSKDRLLYVEVHSTPFSTDSGAYGSFNSFFENTHKDAVTTAIEGREFKTLCPTDHLLYLICHALKHFLHGGFGIRQVCDICLFGRQYDSEIDWEKLALQLKTIKGESFTAAIFVIGKEYLGISLPRAMAGEPLLTVSVAPEDLLSDILASGVYGSSTLNRKHSSRITLMAMEKERASREKRGSTYFRILFPTITSLQRRYPYVKRYPALLPVAWGQRLFGYMGDGSKTDNSIKNALQLGKRRTALLQKYGLLGGRGATLTADRPEDAPPKKRIVDTDSYLSSMLELIREGKEVSIPVTGSSMVPFLGDGRDRVFLRKHEGILERGDIVLYQRKNGDYVLHRICHIRRSDDAERFDLIGDAQTRIEKDIKKEQIFAKATRVERKGQLRGPDSFYWWFFKYIWLDIIPLRHLIIRIYSSIY